MSKHTPGPWTLTREPVPLQDGDERLIVPYWFVDAGAGTCGTEERPLDGFHAAFFASDANARLIAAAPELLEACKRIVHEDNTGEISIGAIEDCRSAIQKAEGAE